MAGLATSIEDQIQKLIDRGMELDIPKEKIEEILLDIGFCLSILSSFDSSSMVSIKLPSVSVLKNILPL